MGLFDKREKMNLDFASGVFFTFSMLSDGRITQMDLDGVDMHHKFAVKCGYVFGLSLPLVCPKIGANNVNKFIDLALKNARRSLSPEMMSSMDDIEKYTRKTSNWVLNESQKYGNDLFKEYAKLFLDDLFEGNNYSNDMMDMATQDMLFYYNNWKEFVAGIKIVKK